MLQTQILFNHYLNFLQIIFTDKKVTKIFEKIFCGYEKNSAVYNLLTSLTELLYYFSIPMCIHAHQRYTDW